MSNSNLTIVGRPTATALWRGRVFATLGPLMAAILGRSHENNDNYIISDYYRNNIAAIQLIHYYHRPTQCLAAPQWVTGRARTPVH